MKKRANDDIPEDEMMLAKLIQNAASRGYRSCRFRYFEPSFEPGPDTVACCARGAAQLEPDTQQVYEDGFVYTKRFSEAAIGNNAAEHHVDGYGDEHGYTLGAAFEQALRP